MQSKKLKLFNSISFWSLIISISLTPVFFLPYTSIGLEFSKGFLFSFGIILSFFFWLVARLIEGKFVLPKDYILWSVFSIPIIFLISALFSSSLYLSLFGQAFEVGTVLSMFVFSLGCFLGIMHFQDKDKILLLVKFLFISTSILVFFQILNIFLNINTLLPGLMHSSFQNNLFGSWNSFSTFLGGITILALFILNTEYKNKYYKIWLPVLILFNLFILSIVNNQTSWLLVLFFSVIVFVYSISKNGLQTLSQKKKYKFFPFYTFITILITLLFLFTHKSLGAFIQQYFDIMDGVLRPSFSGTFEVFKKTILENNILGTGPNTFQIDWALYKPADINLSPFWNHSFIYGSSFFTTVSVTTGILGILSMLVIFVMFMVRGVQFILKSFSKNQENSFIEMVFLVGFYFWIVVFVGYTNNTNIMMAFVFTGIFFASLISKKKLRLREIVFIKDPRESFFAILGIIFFVIISLASLYVYVSKFIGVVMTSSINTQVSSLEEINKVESRLNNALNLINNDYYLRSLSQVYISQLLIVSNDNSFSSDTAKIIFQDLAQKAENSAIKATQLNSKYYINWVNLGDVYSFFNRIGVEGSYDNATKAYEKAFALSGNNPSVILAQAQLEIYNSNLEGSRQLLNKALEIKPNYTDAIFKLVALDLNNGDINNALLLMEKASRFASRDTNVFFNLGLLRYENKDFVGAISAFDTSIRLAKNNLNARYYLALSYEKVGRIEDAKNELNLLSKILPENQEIKNTLNLINSGKSLSQDQESTDLQINQNVE